MTPSPHTDSPTAPERTSPHGDAVLRLPAKVTLFGHDPVETTVDVIPRSRSWRMMRTIRLLALFVIIVPVVGIIPPHAPWIAGALTIAAVLARRRWTERFTIAEFKAPCLRCDHDLTVRSGTRLRIPHPIPCDECGHEPLLTATPPA